MLPQPLTKNTQSPADEFVQTYNEVKELFTKGIEHISLKAASCFESIQLSAIAMPEVLGTVKNKTSNIVAQAISSCVLPALVTQKGEEFDLLRQDALNTLQHWRNIGIHAYNSTYTLSSEVKIDCAKLLQPVISKNTKWVFRFFGNNQSWESCVADLLKMYKATGANVIAPNYRGVGESSNFPKKEEDIIEDYTKLIKEVINEYNVDFNNIYLYGYDFGGYIALRTAVRLQEDKLNVNVINQSSFSSYREVLDDKIPLYPLSHLTSTIFSNNGWPLDARCDLPKLKGRLIVLYNNEDEVFPMHTQFRKAIKELQDMQKLYGTKKLDTEELFEIQMTEKQFLKELQYVPQEYLIHTRELARREMNTLAKAINQQQKKSICNVSANSSK